MRYIHEASTELSMVALLQYAIEITFAAGQSLSEPIDLRNLRAAAIQLPAGWEGTDISFQASVDGQMYDDLGNQYGNEVFAKTALRYIALQPADFASIRFLRIRSGLAGQETAQTQERKLKLIARNV